MTLSNLRPSQIYLDHTADSLKQKIAEQGYRAIDFRVPISGDLVVAAMDGWVYTYIHYLPYSLPRMIVEKLPPPPPPELVVYTQSECEHCSGYVAPSSE